jgi:hypothetical protein
MGLELATKFSELNASNPVHLTDQLSEADDHLRLLKTLLIALGRKVFNVISTETGTAVTAVAGTLHNCTNVAAVTVTLPASPTAGDVFFFHFSNGLSTNVINPNGNDFGNVSGSVTVNFSTVGTLIGVLYLDSATGYILI